MKIGIATTFFHDLLGFYQFYPFSNPILEIPFIFPGTVGRVYLAVFGFTRCIPSGTFTWDGFLC